MLRMTRGTSALAPEEPGEDAGEWRRCPIRSFWQCAAGFWQQRATRVSWALSGILLLTILLNLAGSYGMNVWGRVVFDALQMRDSDTVLKLSMLYLPLLAGSVFMSVMQLCARMTMQRRWREWLNNLIMDRWLKNGRYYQLNFVGGNHQNPEYRIADDLRIATEAPVEFAIGAITAVLSAATFIVVLWTVGGAFTAHIGEIALNIPGFLVFAAVVYAAVASGTMLVIGRRLITVAENKDQAEAEYRYVLTRLRENGEAIALLKGDDEERRGTDKSFKTVFLAWKDICIQTVRTTIVSQTSGYITGVIPIILCAPKFLDNSMTLGEVMQAASAFAIVQSALNWFVDNYPRLAEWAASARRVASLKLSLDTLDRAEIRRIGRIKRGEAKDAALCLRNVSVMLPDGVPVIDGAEVAIMPGEKVLITGESGTGKSTFARALAGAWSWGDGDIDIRAGAKLLVLPQRPYLPIGTLRRAVSYPDAAESRSVEDIAEVLEKVDLDHLVGRLGEDKPWDQILSGGEKQRLAFARILLHRPDIIVLDEATAALDSQSQARVMRLLSRELRDATIVSIGHRSELSDFHHRKITLLRRHGGAKLVSEVHPVCSASRAGQVRGRIASEQHCSARGVAIRGNANELTWSCFRPPMNRDGGLVFPTHCDPR
jgi:vitamin B12/bleomycin/antimicrobial peptide transport system ATP-binding/permease protein